ncbi:hypothetical protein G647_01077 [Cladophialophora carrionii CBS 160.54]|uniref:DUF1682 domain-containing protein n=1 Tax=Cladophialophora carrionii CBS 160.54 TaxID=1279043 RepID=V9DPN7_9EURO|nr:uncharacterized protein G647_01077 [Cladophialophora carrionii CBS 160.54]ETI28626.1 hypothetical protein G647_01077 [Cladophialophora carrionii CBS 160.54]
MDYFKSLVGGKPSQAPIVAEDADFADFAAAPPPSPVSIPASPADAQAASATGANLAAGDLPRKMIYTKWYRVWERTQLSDFTMEAILIPFILLAMLVHFWGTRTNRRKARKWIAVHEPLLEREFALVGYASAPQETTEAAASPVDASLFKEMVKKSGNGVSEDLLKEKSAWEFETYATGRQNVAFADIKISLKRRMNPLVLIAEELTGLFIESVKPKPERVEAVIYTFDGKEKDFVPPPVPGSEETGKQKGVGNSSYDPFVFAVVNKLAMRRLRDERYDLSLTFTKDNAKLPEWTTVMSESAEISEWLLTKELVDAVKEAGPDHFQYLIITDQPHDKPTNLNETAQKKRLHLALNLPSSEEHYLRTLPLFALFLRLPDFLVSNAKLRPEVLRKINAIRDQEKSKLKKISDKEAEEERLRQLDKLKKEERDRKMKGMSAEEQRKFLDRENEKQRKKNEKKMTRRG